MTTAGFPTACRDCGLRIRMVRTAASRGSRRKWMPIDPDPHPAGSIAIDAYNDAAVVGKGNPLHEGELHQPHHETCEAHAARQAQLRPPERADIDR